MKNKKLLIGGASAASIAALGLGALAFFTDEIQLDPLNTKVGSVDVSGSAEITHTQLKREYVSLLMGSSASVSPTAVWEQDDNLDVGGNEVSAEKQALLDLFEEAPNNVNPGDNEMPENNVVPGTDHEIVINVQNDGTKSVRTRILVELSGEDEDGNELTVQELQKVKLYFDYMNTISGLSSVPQLSGDLLEERGTLNRMTSTGNKLLYVLDSYLVYGICDLSEDPNFNIFTDAFSDYALSGLILSGTGENAETELFETYDIVAEEYVTRTAPTSGSIKLDLGLAADAGDSFEGKTLSVKITVQAMQLRNTGEDTWEDMFTETYYVD